jgi:hypothetical protein
VSCSESDMISKTWPVSFLQLTDLSISLVTKDIAVRVVGRSLAFLGRSLTAKLLIHVHGGQIVKLTKEQQLRWDITIDVMRSIETNSWPSRSRLDAGTGSHEGQVEKVGIPTSGLTSPPFIRPQLHLWTDPRTQGSIRSRATSRISIVRIMGIWPNPMSRIWQCPRHGALQSGPRVPADCSAKCNYRRAVPTSRKGCPDIERISQ